MLRLLIGRAGSGKSMQILREICARADAGRGDQLLLVPEQDSHRSERSLCAAGGGRISMYAEALSFTRLANRVFARAGGLADPYLDDGGRILVMNAAMNAVSGALTVYGNFSRKAEFLEGLIRTADELKSWGVTPEELGEAAERAEGNFSKKLRDLSLICGAYAAMTARDAADPRDRLTRLADRLEECDYGRGAVIYVDGFIDFTPQEERVLELLMIRAEEMTVALTCDQAEEDGSQMGIFVPAQRAGARLRRLAARRGIPCQVEFPAEREKNGKDPALRWLEEHYFKEARELYPEPQEAVSVFEADTRFSEVEYAAAYILELVRNRGFRFRDIVVCARNFEEYAVMVESVFERYGVSLFLSEKSDILQKPILTLAVSALETVTGGWEYDDLFRCLKTGLAGLTLEECDLLENYVLRWDIRGALWREDRDWAMSLGGYGKEPDETEREALKRINDLRRRVRMPLAALDGASRAGQTMGEQAEALYGFLESIGLAERLKERAAQFDERGERKLAEEYVQLWDILCAALDQFVDLLGDAPGQPEEFLRLLKLVLSQYDVGTIPVSLDRVTAGGAERVARGRARCLILLGAVDGSFPRSGEAGGLLSDEDRDQLTELGLVLSPDADARMSREMNLVYRIFSLPTERLLVSYPLSGGGGEGLRPSFLTERLKASFVQPVLIREAAGDGSFRARALRPCLDYLAAMGGRREEILRSAASWPDWRGPLEPIRRAEEFRRGRLSEKTARRLYGERIHLSASRLNRVRSCHFAYFIQYGLGARPRKPAGFDAPEAGSFVHYILEQVLRDLEETGGFSGLDPERLRALTKKYIDRYAGALPGQMGERTARFQYLFRRLCESVYPVVENAAEELASSDFRPLAFELRFGEGGPLPPVEAKSGGTTVSVGGFVDRVDGWEKNGKLYLRVMDYKTGKKEFDFADVWHGLGMQTLLYLFALEKNGKTLFGKEVVPAGALFLPARDVIVPAEGAISEEERRKKRDKLLLRSGILLDDPAVLEAMEHGVLSGSRFLPVKAGKDGMKGAVAPAGRFRRLEEHLERTLRQVAEEMRAGTISADPYYRAGGQCACDFCEFRDACQFDERGGEDRRRYLYGLRPEEFWSGLEGRGEA